MSEGDSEDPFARFADLRARAEGSEPFEATRAALATVDAAGHPSVRYVLVKEVGAEGFAFYTNYGSPKARDLDATGRAALAWHWHSVGAQVRASGRVSRLAEARSEAYFAARPRGSQIGAWASAQSTPLASREALLAKVAEAEARFGDGPVPRPPHWGGYLLVPERVEFWHEGEFRLHDRFLYERSGARWRVSRLSP